VRALDGIKNSTDELFREYAPDTKDAKHEKSDADTLYVEVALKLKNEANYDGSAANLVYGDVSVTQVYELSRILDWILRVHTLMATSLMIKL
jgi:hypothetical protein